jgi:UDP-N-acetylglucosamine--N-acetylmuramyl-(pentapeptide) pyrophosphoryl-undecaprenol N-acetylglucosamine transferase
MGANSTKKIVIAAGGTMGHLIPALSVADELAAQGFHVSFVSPKGRAIEQELIVKSGYEYDELLIKGLPRKVSYKQFTALLVAAVAIYRSIKILRKEQAQALLVTGGYISLPMSLASKLLKIPVIVFETDSHLGLGNRIATRVARVLCTAQVLPKRCKRQVVTGRPVKKEFFITKQIAARNDLGLQEDALVLVVIGGSLGAAYLNKMAFEAFALDSIQINERAVCVFHLTGARDYKQFVKRSSLNASYKMLEYTDELPKLFASADLIISRAGGTIFEIAASKKPCILVPSPNVTANHQLKNAEYFKSLGAAIVIEEAKLTSALFRQAVSELLSPTNTKRLEELSLNIGATCSHK